MKPRTPHEKRQKRTIRYSSKFKLGRWPLVSIAFGPDAATGETRGWARGFVAIGDIATGFIAIGGLAGGGIAIGGISVGGLAVGGATLGGLVLGGAAVGVVACGGAAVGHYARGGGVAGTYVLSPHRRDAEAVQLFNTLTPGTVPAEKPEPAVKPETAKP